MNRRYEPWIRCHNQACGQRTKGWDCEKCGDAICIDCWVVHNGLCDECVVKDNQEADAEQEDDSCQDRDDATTRTRSN